jgi:hypothetical protein
MDAVMVKAIVEEFDYSDCIDPFGDDRRTAARTAC